MASACTLAAFDSLVILRAYYIIFFVILFYMFFVIIYIKHVIFRHLDSYCFKLSKLWNGYEKLVCSTRRSATQISHFSHATKSWQFVCLYNQVEEFLGDLVFLIQCINRRSFRSGLWICNLRNKLFTSFINFVLNVYKCGVLFIIGVLLPLRLN